MRAINIWNKLNLYSAQISLLVLITSGVFAQEVRPIHNPNYDENRVITYGFSIGFHNSAYKLNYSQAFVDRLDSVQSIQPRNSLGFSLGFIVNARIADFFDARITPKVGFYEYKLEYNYLNAPQFIEVEEATVVELPILFKYKSERRVNTRMYVIGGITPSFEASGTNDLEENQEFLQVNKFGLAAEFGFGLDLYYPLFKFSPEIRFSRGLVNSLSSEKNDVSEGIDKLFTNVVGIYLHFQ